jgi:hypothetical protein
LRDHPGTGPEQDADQTSVFVLSALREGLAMSSPLPLLDPEQRSTRGRIAALTRSNPERAAELRRDFHVDRIEQQIKTLVESAPPLTDAQRDRLRSLLAPRRGGA